MVISVLDGAGVSKNLATGAGDGSGTPFTSPAAVGIGAPADAAVSNPASSASIIAAVKGTNTLLAAGLPGSLGQKAMSASQPVVIASDQSPVPIINGATKAASAGFARPANATAYGSGQLVANSTTAGSVVVPTITAARANDIGGFIPQIQLKKTGTSFTLAQFRVHFYNAQPTPSNGDGAAWLTGSIDNYIGFFDVTMSQAFTSGASGLGIPYSGAGLMFTPVSGAQTLYWMVEARAAYTPVSGETFSLNIWVN